MSNDRDKTSDEDGQRWAADEPTAMWDDSEMRDAGYDELAQDRSATARLESAPATASAVGGQRAAPVEVSPELASRPVPSPAAPKPQGGLSWLLTGALAVALGVVAYVLVRLLR